MSGQLNLPTPQDICDLILSVLPSGLSSNTITVISNVCENLNNEYITLNEVYNFILNALPQVRSFFAQVDFTGSLNTTFKDYTVIWILFQYGVILLIFSILITTLGLTGTIRGLTAFLLFIGVAMLLILIGVLEVFALNSFLNDQQTNFEAKLTAAFQAMLPPAILNGVLGYVSASQLTINGPTGPTGPGNGPIILTDPNTTFNLDPPYFKLTIFRTLTPITVSQPAVFNVLLKEEEIVSGIIRINTVKPQYAKIIYVINSNPPFFYPALAGVTGVTGDSGVIRILNATTSQPSVALVAPAEIPLSSTDPPFEFGISLSPPQVNNGVLLYPGECKCFINVGYNQTLPELSSDIPNLAFSTWVEVTSDVRPFNMVVTSNAMEINLRPTNRIVFLNIPNGASVNLITSASTNIAINGQELYLVANPPSGSINVILFNGVFVLLKGQMMALTFNGIVWTKLFP